MPEKIFRLGKKQNSTMSHIQKNPQNKNNSERFPDKR